MLPEPASTQVRFAHPAYRLSERFAPLNSTVNHAQTWDRDKLARDLVDTHVLVISGFWENSLLDSAPVLRFIQVCGAGYDQFDQAALRRRGIRLCNASGVNANAVSEHALALMLSLNRQLHLARDNQRLGYWRPMISSLTEREDELPEKTVLIVGAGRIGSRLARLCRALDMTVVGIKRDLSRRDPAFHGIHPPEAFQALLPRADFVVLCCPLTEQTRDLIDTDALMIMRPSAFLINVARGPCIDEAALLQALEAGELAGAAIDVATREPLLADSPLWTQERLIITPHSAGETRAYEDRVLAILNENLTRLWQSNKDLLNQVV